MISIGSRTTARSDASAGGADPVLFAETWPADDTIEECLDRALAHGKPARNCAIFLESAFLQTLELAAASTASLADEELSRAVAFELEPYCGIPATEAVVAVRRAGPAKGGKVLIHALAVRASEIDSIAKVLERRDARLFWLGHPSLFAGDPTASATVPGVIEVRPHTTAMFGFGGEPVRFLGARAGQRSWTKSVEEWLSITRTDSIVWRGVTRSAAIENPPQKTTITDAGPLPEEKDAAPWFARCAAVLRGKSSSVPIIRPKVRSALHLPVGFIAVVATVAIAGYFGFDAWTKVGEAKELEQKIAEASVYEGRAVDLMRTNAGIQKRASELQQETEQKSARVSAIEGEWAAQNKRFGALLAIIAGHRPNGLLITRIAPRNGGVLEVEGIGAESSAIDTFVAEVAPLLQGKRWEISPARLTEDRAPSGASFHRFTFSATPALAFGEKGK